MKQIKELAGTVVHNVTHSPYWSPYDIQYGDGGSQEYPLRTSVEVRIKPPNQILQLKNKELRIEPTNRCNYECIMCPRELHSRVKGVMPMAFFKSIVDEGILMGIERVVLSNFGEPFIDPTLEDKIQYCSEHDLNTYIITNASLLHTITKSTRYQNTKITRAEAAIRSGLTELRFSFYGTTPESYTSIMKGGNFVQTRKNIEHFLELRKNIGRYGISPTSGETVLLPEVSMYFLDLQQNKSDFNDFVKFTNSFADYYEVWKPHNFGLGRLNTYRNTESDVALKTCGRPENGPLQINWQGIVTPCCYDFNQEVPLGNVALQTIEEVVTGTPYVELRKCHANGEFSCIPYCNKCDQLRERASSFITSTNKRHIKLTPEEIVKRTNTQPGVSM